MPALFILRLVFGFFSLAVLGAAGWLLWSWYQGDLFYDVDGALERTRHDWRLWAGLALLAFSFFGRFLVTPVLARADQTPYRPMRGEGRMIASPTGASLYVEQAGLAQGPTIVFTHGWGLDSTIWTLAKRDLGSRYRLLLWDLPGLGRSNPGREKETLERFATDLEAVMAQAGGPCLLVGHSIGGMTIQTLARDRKALVNKNVAGIVLLNTTYTNPLKTMVLSGLVQSLRPLLEVALHLTKWLEPLAQLSAWQGYLSGSAHIANRFEFASQVTRAQLEHTTLLGVKNRQGIVALGNLAMFRWDATGALKDLDTPVLVLGGKTDIVTKPEASRYIAKQAARGELRIVEDANHMGFVERAGVYNEAIARFAAEVHRVAAPLSEPAQ
jgi:pimeloyl-ACP methyl ester carboxylesterase